jgi:hypothetical protein
VQIIAYQSHSIVPALKGYQMMEESAAQFAGMEDFIKMKSVMMETMLMEMDVALLAWLKLITNV